MKQPVNFLGVYAVSQTPPTQRPAMPVVEGWLWYFPKRGGKRKGTPIHLGSIAVQRAVVRFAGYVLTMDFGTS